MGNLIVAALCAAISGYALSRLKKCDNSFAEEEAKRYFLKFNEIDGNWSSHGKVYTKGIALIEDKKTGEKKFISQAELNDVGILS